MLRPKILWWFLLILVFAIPLFQSASSALLVVSTLLSFFVRGKFTFSRYLAHAWDLWLYFAILSTGLLYTENSVTGLSVLETSLSFLALPLILIRLGGIDKKQLYEMLYAFGAGLLIASVICLARGSIACYGGEGWSAFSADRLTESLENTHPVYFAYYLILMITFGLYLIYNQESVLPHKALIGTIVFFFMMLVLMSSGTAVLSILFSFLYFILKFLFERERTREKKVTFGLALFFLVFLFIVNWVDTVETYSFRQDDYWERFVLWESAINAMPNWITGVGTGDYNIVLNEYYVAHDLSTFAASNYNPHNQFIETLFCNGLAGLAALLFMLCRPMYHAITRQNIIGFLAFFPFLIYGMTEVFLGRYQGVIFFAILHQAFISFFLSGETGNSLKNG